MTNSEKQLGSHDEFVAKCFEDLDIARAFLCHYLPETIREQVDLDRIELKQGSYVDEDLRRSYSDLTYTVPLHDDKSTRAVRKAFVYILIEHKSESDEFTVFQLLRYMVRIWQRELEGTTSRADFRLPPIVPLVLHHGRTAFRAPVEFNELVTAIPGMEAFVPKYRCLLVDLMAVAPNELPAADERLHAILAVMRSVFGDEIGATLREAVARLATLADRPRVQELLGVVFNYVLRSARNLTDEEFLTAVEPLAGTGGDTMSTLINKWKEEGRIEDRQESIIDILSTRFGTVPDSLQTSIRAISDSEQLLKLRTTAVVCESVSRFAEDLK